MSLFLAKINDIKTKLTAINNVYPSYCISSLVNNGYWTSTECNNNGAYLVSTANGYVNSYSKKTDIIVIAMLAY